MAEQRPAEVRRMENGHIGETRAAELLSDRFWILERSVDIEGADLLIQRRLVRRHILDSVAPRMGVVQAKFYQDNNTTQYVPREYVVDNEGRPRKEFFVLCFSGYEDDRRAAFLTARDLVDNFRLMEPGSSHPNSFSLPGNAVFVERFLITSRKAVLDNMDQAIHYADLVANRTFILHDLPYISTNPYIDPVYEYPIDNNWRDIAEQFAKLKQKARSAMFDVEDFYEQLQTIVSASDPEVAIKAARRIDDYYDGSVGISGHDRLYDEDFDTRVKSHRETVEHLQRKGVLDAFLKLQKQVEDQVIVQMVPRMPLRHEQGCLLTVRYDSATLSPTEIRAEAAAADAGKGATETGVVHSEPGMVVVYTGRRLVAERWDTARREYVEVTGVPQEVHLRESMWLLRLPLMEEVFRHLR